jgi:hypothetical protein
MKMEQTECSETSSFKIQTPGNYPDESIQHSEHGESLKSRIQVFVPQKQIIPVPSELELCLVQNVEIRAIFVSSVYIHNFTTEVHCK